MYYRKIKEEIFLLELKELSQTLQGYLESTNFRDLSKWATERVIDMAKDAAKNNEPIKTVMTRLDSTVWEILRSAHEIHLRSIFSPERYELFREIGLVNLDNVKLCFDHKTRSIDFLERPN